MKLAIIATLLSFNSSYSLAEYTNRDSSVTQSNLDSSSSDWENNQHNVWSSEDQDGDDITFIENDPHYINTDIDRVYNEEMLHRLEAIAGERSPEVAKAIADYARSSGASAEGIIGEMERRGYSIRSGSGGLSREQEKLIEHISKVAEINERHQKLEQQLKDTFRLVGQEIREERKQIAEEAGKGINERYQKMEKTELAKEIWMSSQGPEDYHEHMEEVQEVRSVALDLYTKKNPTPFELKSSILSMALADMADNAFIRKFVEEGNSYLTIARQMLANANPAVALALGAFTPIGNLESLYEAITGEGVHGRKLEAWEQTLAGIGAIPGLGGIARFGFKNATSLLKKIAIKYRTKAGDIYQGLRHVVDWGTVKFLPDIVTRIRLTALNQKILVARYAGFAKMEANSVKLFNRLSNLRNPHPKNGIYARVVSSELYEKIVSGKIGIGKYERMSELDGIDGIDLINGVGEINDKISPYVGAWVTAWDDVKNLKPAEYAKRMALFDSKTKKLIDTKNWKLIKFKMKPGRTPVLVPGDMSDAKWFVPGGKTLGGAREWLLDSMENLTKSIEIVQ